MKNTILTALAFFLCISANAQWWSKGVKGNGKVITETRTTSDYDGIRCAGSMDYILVAGDEGKITIEGEENLLKHIVTEVKKGQLVVKVEKGVNLKPSWKKGIKVTIPFKDIDKVSLAGSGDLWNEDKIMASDLDVSLAGSGDITLDIESNRVKGSIAGSGDLTLKGNTNDLEASVAGSGDIHGFDLNANNADVSVAGSGDIKVTSKKSIKARVAGSGDIVYRGNPEREDTKVSGSGSISNN